MKDNRRLGRGLAGLIGDNYDNKEDQLSTSLLHPSKFQPRKYFDEKSLKELASSVEKNGIIQPIVVQRSK